MSDTIYQKGITTQLDKRENKVGQNSFIISIQLDLSVSPCTLKESTATQVRYFCYSLHQPFLITNI